MTRNTLLAGRICLIVALYIGFSICFWNDIIFSETHWLLKVEFLVALFGIMIWGIYQLTEYDLKKEVERRRMAYNKVRKEVDKGVTWTKK